MPKNTLIALREAQEWAGVLHYNESSFDTVAQLPPPWDERRHVPFVWTDSDDVKAAAWLQHRGICVGKEIAGQAIQAVAREHPFHPIRDYLNGLQWDGVARIDAWLKAYLGAEASSYTAAVGAKWLIGAVARVFKPGCKNDTCLIFEGEQGILKSTTLQILGGDWYTDDMPELGTKDAALQARGVWIIELSELDSLSRSEVSRTKAYMSRAVDRFRPPYGRHPITAPRECVFAGTVNPSVYLRDETGNRRFWPVKCGRIDIPALSRDRDQLWAEAVMRFRAADTWWLQDKAVIQMAQAEAEARYEADPWQSMVIDWVEYPKQRSEPSGHPIEPFTSDSNSVTVFDVLLHCVGKRPDQWTAADQKRVAGCLTAIKWERYRDRSRGMQWRYRRKP